MDRNWRQACCRSRRARSFALARSCRSGFTAETGSTDNACRG